MSRWIKWGSFLSLLALVCYIAVSAIAPSPPRIVTIRAMAAEAQEWAVAYAKEHNMDADTLAGVCAVASTALSLRLTKKGIKNQLVLNRTRYNSHVFVLVDGLIVDITPRQADPSMPAIIISTPYDLRRQTSRRIMGWWFGSWQLFDDPTTLKKQQEAELWPPEQLFPTCSIPIPIFNGLQCS